MQTLMINPQCACARGFSSQFVCLSTSDLEDDSVFTFEHQRELGDNLSPLKVALF